MGFFSNAWKKVKKVAKKVVNTVKKVVRVVKEVVHRIVGVLDFIGSLLGIRPRKFLRLKVYILTDLKKRPIQTEQEVNRWVDETRRILKERMNVELQSADLRAGQSVVAVIPDPAPVEAVFPGCSFGDAFGDAADYYEDHFTYVHTSTWNFIGDAIGYGEPIYAFVVAQIDGGKRNGCAYPWIHNLVLVEQTPRTTTLAHEIGHQCGLTHVSASQNLMKPDRADMDSKLNRWQISVFRNSRYVTFFRP